MHAHTVAWLNHDHRETPSRIAGLKLARAWRAPGIRRFPTLCGNQNVVNQTFFASKKKPTWPNTARHSTTSAYSLTSPPAQTGLPFI
jgi:hypothetical protein